MIVRNCWIATKCQHKLNESLVTCANGRHKRGFAIMISVSLIDLVSDQVDLQHGIDQVKSSHGRQPEFGIGHCSVRYGSWLDGSALHLVSGR